MAPDERSPMSSLMRPAARTFFNAPVCDDLDALEAQVAFLGVPWDAGVIVPMIRSGASAGPRLVRDTRTRLKDTQPDGSQRRLVRHRDRAAAPARRPPRRLRRRARGSRRHGPQPRPHHRGHRGASPSAAPCSRPSAATTRSASPSGVAWRMSMAPWTWSTSTRTPTSRTPSTDRSCRTAASSAACTSCPPRTSLSHLAYDRSTATSTTT